MKVFAIVLPPDFSRHDEVASATALETAARGGARIVALHVLPRWVLVTGEDPMVVVDQL